MTDPRGAAFTALREAEASAKCLHDVVTVGTIEQVRITLEQTINVQRRLIEWLDAIELPWRITKR